MTDARRAVARILLGDMCKTISERVTEILAWHDAEMRAAQDELAELTAEGERLVMALNAKDAETRALREAGLQFVAEIMPRYREVFEAANLGVFLDSIGNQEARKFLALLTPTPGAGKA